MASGTHRIISTRSVRKIEAPRPLKDSSLNELNAKPSYSPLALSSFAIDSVEKLIALMDMVVNSINQIDDVNANLDPSLLTSNIVHLCKHLKIYGSQLENSIYQGQLDRAFLSFREGMVRGTLEYEARVHLLDIVELRECNWIPRKEFSSISNTNAMSLSPSYQDFYEYYSEFPPYQQLPNDSSLVFEPEDVIKRPGKLREKSSKSGSKNYLRNEVVIRNSDSGKVMGIKGRRVHMIEQLSETIISFQRVPPTAKERVVQITGPSEDKISYATKLIENTIRNNASPVKEFCESESSCSSEDSLYGTSAGCDEFGNYFTNSERTKFDQPYLYKHKVIVRNCHLTITGDDYTYVTVAKAILDDYFSKMRMSESPDDINYSDDVFLDERLLKDENLKNPSSYNLNDVSGSGDYKSYVGAQDFADKSNTIPLTEDPLAYVDCNLPNFSSSFQTESMLSSGVSSLSLTPNYRDISDLSFLPPASEPVIDEIEPLEACSAAVAPTDEPKSSRTFYSKEFLLECKSLESSNEKPKDWEIITRRFPQLIKETEESPEIIVID